MVYCVYTMDINYITGDANYPQGEGAKIICHINNDIGGWGRGFVLALNKRWRAPETSYREWYRNSYRDCFELGAVRLVRVEDDIWVANMVAQHDIRTIEGLPPIRYDALRSCLRTLRREAVERVASVHMPRIGCGLAGGSWPVVENLVLHELGTFGIPVTVYDLPK